MSIAKSLAIFSKSKTLYHMSCHDSELICMILLSGNLKISISIP